MLTRNVEQYIAQTMSPAELRRMQLVQHDMLATFDKICRKHGLRYIIASGTLLGAVRHKGFIPWDDDIDIEMLRGDYDKFVQVANSELAEFAMVSGSDSAKIFFQDHKADKHYPWLYGKLRMNGTTASQLGQEHLKMHKGIFVDIFPRDPIPNSPFGKLVYESITKVCRKILYSRVMKVSADSSLKRFGWTIVNFMPKIVPFGIVRLLRESVDINKSERVRIYGYHGRYETEGFDKRWFTELTELEFEGEKYYAPADWDGYLTHVYGVDYMTPPPEDKRGPSAPLSSFSFDDGMVGCLDKNSGKIKIYNHERVKG